MPAMSVTDLLFDSLKRIETKVDRVDAKQDEHAERLIRVETLLAERTVRHARRRLMSGSALTAAVSGLLLGAWELIKSRLR